MTTRERQILAEAKAAILSVEPAAEVILFGSRARGEAHEESDFDLMIVTPQEVRVLERGPYFKRTVEIDMKYGEMLSLFFISRTQWRAERRRHHFLRQVYDDGITV